MDFKIIWHNILLGKTMCCD